MSVRYVALRKTMGRAHRQAWCWQDEWFGLTMDDIRLLENETQSLLNKKFGNSPANDHPDSTTGSSEVSFLISVSNLGF